MGSTEHDTAASGKTFDDFESGMQERLRAILRDFSHAAIARRTGIRPQYVQRYLAGTRVPAAFCSLLVDRMGINAQWLLVGAGAPRIAEISEEALAKTGGLLELVKAMNAVASMRLGELFGKDHLKVLRELSDALDRFESIKRSLGAQSRGTYEQVLNNLNQAITNRNQELARNLCGVAEQVSRLCDDEKMNARLDAMRSRIEFNAGNPDDSLRYARRSYLRLLFDDEQANSAEFYDHAFNFLMRLAMTCRYREARNRLQALLELGEEQPVLPETRNMLLGLRAHIDNDLGFPARAADAMLDMYPRAADTTRGHLSPTFVRSMLLSGRSDFSLALNIGVDNPYKAMEILRFAMWLEDLGALKLAARRYIDEPERKMFDDSPDNIRDALILSQTRCMIAMLERGDASQLPRWLELNERDRATPDNNISARVSCVILPTQMLRLAGRLDEAREWLNKSAGELAAIGPAFTTNIVTRAIHHRNALELIPKESRAQQDRDWRTAAQKFFDESFAQGYGCFQKWASRARLQ